MTNEPEMRASDTEREHVAERLREAAADGRLDMDEFQERLDLAFQARTRGELEPLVRDLPATTGSAAPEARPDDRWGARIGGRPHNRYLVGVLGGFSRRGMWTVARKLTALTVMGGGEVDLRQADFEDREVVIRCVAVMGGIGVVVPPGVGVDVRGIGIMGGFDQTTTKPADPGAPTVIVTGFAFWGGVGVRRAKAKEMAKLEVERPRLEKGGKHLGEGGKHLGGHGGGSH
ncbi:DUF1707 domain-containing protein [Streptomyces sp. NPDC005438]|uniref:DUF1707 SHOCT-like domain-containing protein n=1 Tax=Streptomyces sp. NPDC005438 TaxID=3156880 RepID=UPI00339FB1C1